MFPWSWHSSFSQPGRSLSSTNQSAGFIQTRSSCSTCSCPRTSNLLTMTERWRAGSWSRWTRSSTSSASPSCSRSPAAPWFWTGWSGEVIILLPLIVRETFVCWQESLTWTTSLTYQTLWNSFISHFRTFTSNSVTQWFTVWYPTVPPSPPDILNMEINSYSLCCFFYNDYIITRKHTVSCDEHNKNRPKKINE